MCANRIFYYPLCWLYLKASTRLWDFLICPLWFHSTNGIYKFYSLEISNRGYLDCCRQLLMVFLLLLIPNTYNPWQSFLKLNEINSFFLCLFSTSFCSTQIHHYLTQLSTFLFSLPWTLPHVTRQNFLLSKYFIQIQIKGCLITMPNTNTLYQL